MPYVSYNPAWIDANASWQVKAQRAMIHIAELQRLVSGYRASEPFSLVCEPTDDSNCIAYRLRFSKPVPIEISAVVGDILNNLRGALESLAYEIARIGLGGSFANAKQERAPTFPICSTPEAFDKFIDAQAKQDLAYTGQAKSALRQVQPFAFLEMAGGPETMETSYEEHSRMSELYRLHQLWNIDKHRRLTVVAWRPDLLWWGSNGPTQRRVVRGDGTAADDSVLFYVEGSDEGYGTEVNVEYKLALVDDPVHHEGRIGGVEDVTDLMSRLYDHIVRAVVFPQVFTAMSEPASRFSSGDA